VPREQRAHRSAGGAAESHHFVPFQLFRVQESLEHPGRECRVATAALARYRHPLTFVSGVQGHPRLRRFRSTKRSFPQVRCRPFATLFLHDTATIDKHSEVEPFHRSPVAIARLSSRLDLVHEVPRK
jgi:hypothetical protein